MKIRNIVFLCLLPIGSFAGDDQEKLQLSLIKQQIVEIQNQLKEARRLGEHNTHAVKFNYDALSSDLVLIERGLDDYINKRQFAPRQAEPLIGDYRR